MQGLFLAPRSPGPALPRPLAPSPPSPRAPVPPDPQTSHPMRGIQKLGLWAAPMHHQRGRWRIAANASPKPVRTYVRGRCTAAQLAWRCAGIAGAACRWCVSVRGKRMQEWQRENSQPSRVGKDFKVSDVLGQRKHLGWTHYFIEIATSNILEGSLGRILPSGRFCQGKIVDHPCYHEAPTIPKSWRARRTPSDGSRATVF